MAKEIYVSTDVEADGPIPGPYSMLQFGSAAFRLDGTSGIQTFHANLELLQGASQHPATMKFWSENQKAYDGTRVGIEPPALVIPRYVKWLQALPGKVVFVGYPACYDFMWVYWYLMKFAGESPFSHSGLDIKTAAMMVLKKNYRDSTKKGMPSQWFSKKPHTHNGLDDALEQGELFVNMMHQAGFK